MRYIKYQLLSLLLLLKQHLNTEFQLLSLLLLKQHLNTEFQLLLLLLLLKPRLNTEFLPFLLEVKLRQNVSFSSDQHRACSSNHRQRFPAHGSPLSSRADHSPHIRPWTRHRRGCGGDLTQQLRKGPDFLCLCVLQDDTTSN